MPEYAKILQEEVACRITDKKPIQDSLASLQDYIEGALRSALSEDKVHIPDAVASHDMPLGRAIDEMKDPSSHAWSTSHLTRWLAAAHAREVSSYIYRTYSKEKDIDTDKAVQGVLQFGRQLLAEGNFSLDLPDRPMIAQSKWDGDTYELHVENWTFKLRKQFSGPLRMRPAYRPLRQAPLPETIEVEMAFPTGKVLIASDAIVKSLANSHVEMRQKADTQGLLGEINITESILATNMMLTYGIASSSLTIRQSDNEMSLVHLKDPDDYDDENNFLLDYRHMTIADEQAYIEFFRKKWDDKDEDVISSYAKARKSCELRIKEVSVTPGRYHVTIPANHTRCLPESLACLGANDYVSFNMRLVSAY